MSDQVATGQKLIVGGGLSGALVHRLWPIIFNGDVPSSTDLAIAVGIGAVMAPILAFYWRALELELHVRLRWISRRRFNQLMDQTHRARFDKSA